MVAVDIRVVRAVLDGLSGSTTDRSKRLAEIAAAVQARSDGWRVGAAITGFGFSHRVRDFRVERNERCIKVYVEQKVPNDALTEAQRIPESIEVERLGRVPVDVQQLSRMRAYGPTPRSGSPPREPLHDLDATRLDPGDHVGVQGAGAGTLGCIVRVGGDDLFGLTSSHVVAQVGTTQDYAARFVGTTVHRFDRHGSRYSDAPIGTVAHADNIRLAGDSYNFSDIAAIRLDLNREWSNRVKMHEGPRGMAETSPSGGWSVRGYGALSGPLRGEVTDPYWQGEIEYEVGGVMRYASFKDCILTTFLGQPGDSGALGMSTSDNGLGFLVGGTNEGTVYCKFVNSRWGIARALGVAAEDFAIA